MSQICLWGQATLNYYLSKRSRIFVGSNVQFDKFSGTDVQMKYDSVKTDVMFSHSKIYYELIGNKFTFTAGGELMYTKFDETYSLINQYPTNFTNALSSNFYQVEYFPDEMTCLSMGLRGEYASIMDKFNVAPRLYVSHKLNDNHILSFTAGTYFQNPANNYLKLNRQLDYSYSDNLTLSYVYAEDREKLQLDLFYKRYSDLITYELNGIYSTNIGNDGNGYARGVDVFWKKNIGMLEYWLSYSYIDTKRKYLTFTERLNPGNIAEHSFKFETKYWVSPIKSMLAASNILETGKNSVFYVNGDIIKKKTPYYNNLKLSISYLPVQNVIVHFYVQNVLGRKNVYGYSGSAYSDKYVAVTNPSTRSYYIGFFYTFSAFGNKNQLNLF
jgi:outer membrane receptor for ferrienterochelin and colicin